MALVDFIKKSQVEDLREELKSEFRHVKEEIDALEAKLRDIKAQLALTDRLMGEQRPSANDRLSSFEFPDLSDPKLGVTEAVKRFFEANPGSASSSQKCTVAQLEDALRRCRFPVKKGNFRTVLYVTVKRLEDDKYLLSVPAGRTKLLFRNPDHNQITFSAM